MTDDELIVAILRAADELKDERFQHDFYSDFMPRRAAERLVEIVGDMISRFSDEFKAAHPEIEYRNAKRMRNILAHHYNKTAADRVWESVHVDIPELARQLNGIAIANQIIREP